MSTLPSAPSPKRVTLSVATEGHPSVVEIPTGRDSAIGASIENQEYRDKPHVFTISRDLRIVAAIPAGI